MKRVEPIFVTGFTLVMLASAVVLCKSAAQSGQAPLPPQLRLEGQLYVKNPPARSKAPTTCYAKSEQQECATSLAEAGRIHQARDEVALCKESKSLGRPEEALGYCDAALKLLPSARIMIPGEPKAVEDAAAAELETLRSEARKLREELIEQRVKDEKAEIDLLVKQSDSELWHGNLDRATAICTEIKQRFIQATGVESEVRSYALQQLNVLAATKKYDPRYWIGWLIANASKTILAVLFVCVGLLLALLLLLALRWGVLFSYTWLWNVVWKRVKWTVWTILDEEKQGGAGAVMDSLIMRNNPLLRRQFPPPALLLAPPHFAGASGVGMWWGFLGVSRPLFRIEEIPLEKMQRHVFALDEAFEEVNVKVPGLEISGLVTAVRALRRWLRKGLPSAQGSVVKVKSDAETISWAVRLTCNVSRLGLGRGSPEETTLSVYSSSPDQEYLDAIGLAAQRSAFKLFYRLADPYRNPDEITAIAAFHQAMALLRRYL